MELAFERDRVGFNIGINIAGGSAGTGSVCPSRLGQYFLKVSTATDACSGTPWCDTRSFCTSERLSK
jgi:hypothetical protein